MSLKLDDWKAIIEQPKNLGLKAGGGTGVSAALRKVADKEAAYRDKRIAANGQALEAALIELKRLCIDVVKKHKKLFTTACAHLEKAIASADARMKDLTGELNELRQTELVAKTRQANKKSLTDLCENTIKTFRAVQTEKELRDACAAFKAEFAKLSKPFPKLAAQVAKVNSFDKKDPVKGLLGIRADFIQLAQDSGTAASGA